LSGRACAAALALALAALTACGSASSDAPGRAVYARAAEERERLGMAAEDAPAGTAAETVRHESYIQGKDGFFCPGQSCTRAEAAQIFSGLGFSAPGGTQFSDVPPASWYAPAVSGLSGALRGYGDGTFRPGKTLTQAELLSVLCRLAQMPLREDRPGEPWYAPAAEAAAQAGWLDGLPGLDPAAAATRAQVVSICNRATGRVPDEAAIDALGQVFLDVAPGDFAYYDIAEAALGHSVDWSEYDAPPSFSPGLHRVGDAAYYVEPDGSIAKTPGLLSRDGETYLVGGGGRIYADGALHPLDGGPVFCTAEGPLLKNGSWHDFQFDADGRYTSGDAELDALVEAIIAAQTTPDMTPEQKLYACYCAVRGYGYLGRNAALPASVKTMPGENARAYAKKIYTTGKGDCYNFAAAFCYLARRLGYDATAVVGVCAYNWNTRPIAHSWVEIPMDGAVRIFDPQIENYNLRHGISNERCGAFKVTYETAPARYIKN